MLSACGGVENRRSMWDIGYRNCTIGGDCHCHKDGVTSDTQVYVCNRVCVMISKISDHSPSQVIAITSLKDPPFVKIGVCCSCFNNVL